MGLKLLRLLAALSAAGAAWFAVVLWRRSQLSYNSQGRYIEPAEGIVYHESAKVAYAVLILGLLAMCAGAALAARSLARRREIRRLMRSDPTH